MSHKYIFRKELAEITELSARTIKNNETEWGIDIYRRDANRRMIRYLREPALKLLREKKVI
jgi:hypothetical protein